MYEFGVHIQRICWIYTLCYFECMNWMYTLRSMYMLDVKCIILCSVHTLDIYATCILYIGCTIAMLAVCMANVLCWRFLWSLFSKQMFTVYDEHVH